MAILHRNEWKPTLVHNGRAAELLPKEERLKVYAQYRAKYLASISAHLDELKEQEKKRNTSGWARFKHWLGI